MKNYCKKIMFGNSESEQDTSCLFGLIVKDDGEFIELKTMKKIHRINKRFIISISDTDKEFIDER